MSFETDDRSQSFWGIVEDLELDIDPHAELRMGIAENPLIKLAIRWQLENPHLTTAERTNARDNLIAAATRHFDTSADQAHRAITICEHLIEQESTHG